MTDTARIAETLAQIEQATTLAREALKKPDNAAELLKVHGLMISVQCLGMLAAGEASRSLRRRN